MFFFGLLSSHLTYLLLVVIYICGYGSMVLNDSESDLFSVLSTSSVELKETPKAKTFHCEKCQQVKAQQETSKNLFRSFKPSKPHKIKLHFKISLNDLFNGKTITSRPPPALV